MKRNFGLRARVFTEVGAIIAACIIALALVNSQMLGSVYLWNAQRELKSAASKIESTDKGKLNETIKDLESKNNFSIDLYDNEDNYIYESTGSFISGAKIMIVSRTENEDGSYFNIVTEEGDTTQYIIYGADFDNGYHLEITSQKDPIQENADIAAKVTTIVSVVALLLALVFISLYARRFTKPLIKMSKVTEKMSNLDFSEKLDINRRDEIGALANSINTLSSSLDTALTELKTTNEHLSQDIEKGKALDNMRKEFISSASHELKTPIAIIRGYAEGLKMVSSPEDETAQEYCDIIMKEADRMNDLVLGLLEVSVYSSGAGTPQKGEFLVNEFVSYFMKKTKPIFEDKGITASFEESNDIAVTGDKRQLETVLSNLVSNACSHAGGEKTVRITTEEKETTVRVSVYNSGSHINDEDKDKLFNSFYRADKAHSRAQGRFGLGLSIVRSIMDLHGTECGFYNTDDGVVFWFEIEKAKDEN